jgi:hypothetical protein
MPIKTVFKQNFLFRRRKKWKIPLIHFGTC